jgi:O-succinylbenzoate synthase
VPSGVAIGLYDTIEELLDRAERFLKQGYRRLKIKIQPGWDIEPVRAVRERFGDIPLMADANASYTIRDAKVFEELDRFS